MFDVKVPTVFLYIELIHSIKYFIFGIFSICTLAVEQPSSVYLVRFSMVRNSIKIRKLSGTFFNKISIYQ